MQFSQQQLETAYKQMERDRQADAAYAQHAADDLQHLLRHPQTVQTIESGLNRGAITPFTTTHVLVVNLSQHDDWQQCYDDLVAAGVAMKPWNGKIHSAPEGEFDLSKDQHFAGRSKQQYAVRIDYYDGGY